MVEREPLTAVPMEIREKIIQVAEDILDREGHIDGCIYRSPWSAQIARLTGAPHSMHKSGYCAVGAMREAMSVLGITSNDWKSSETVNFGYAALREVADTMGWSLPEIDRVWRANDYTSREAAFEMARALLEGAEEEECSQVK